MDKINDTPTYVREDMKRTLKGSELLKDLYIRYSTDISKYLNQTFGSGPPEPEDIVQEVFMKFSDVPHQNQILNPRAYLYRSAHNLVMNYYVKAKTRKRLLLEQKNVNNSEINDQIHPERILLARERLNKLERALWNMPLKRRRMIIRNRFDGATYAEISRETGISATAVRKHVYKALADIEKAFEEFESQNNSEQEADK